ncbi:acyl-CoA carboxylase subunit beta [Natronolimnohabitans innermongolicus]|uniref:Carboxyl transferase n=1 Tax=Natronolimnohabitans innermongolicus JCM 12255 TaxID=1227499 RepID=L9WNG0_9EURY|nr:carboxyl transferase domain-containing protein [Natronolimnohabitans innermongolicus]ELY50932.1 carboxyl transferase [Natronolimnohabitans innermongolicus JCM 12255]
MTDDDPFAAVDAAKDELADETREDAVAYQHDLGKLTARERIDYLLDEDSFDEIGRLAAPMPTTPETTDWEREDAPADGVVTGFGRIDGRPIAIFATDFTVKGGSIGHAGGRKIKRVTERALERGTPLIMLHDGGGHRIQEGLDAAPFARGDNGFSNLQTTLSGWVPVVSAMMGPAFAAPTNFAALSDFVPIVEGTGTMGVAGPSLVKSALGVDETKEELGSARFQTTETGMADLACEDDEACLDAIRTYLSYLPRNAECEPPTVEAKPPDEDARERLRDIIPSSPRKGYDIDAIIEGIVDRGSTFELKPTYGRNIVTAFARLEGEPIGVIANNPRFKAGTIDTAASEKASHFAAVCDAFGLPIVTLTDVPGILPGPDSEREGIARHSAKLPFELARATVPIANVVLRRGYGFGYVAMGGGRSLDSELTVLWPTAELAAMGIEGAVDIAYKREIESADDPEARRRELIDTFEDRTDAVRAAERVGVDGVIQPAETRGRIRRAFDRAADDRDRDWPPKKRSINPI